MIKIELLFGKNMTGLARLRTELQFSKCVI